MKNNIYKALGMGAILMAFPSLGFAHGYVDSPGARNYFCGAVTKPDQVANGTAQYPVCGDAFANDFNGGYSYMSVLNHHGGRMERSSTNVCGFDSETWKGGKTPWDNAINWPVNNINGGQITFNWDISNGPHFDDTSDFRYWITKPGFQYQVGKELTWNDFEAQPFCNLAYNDDNPSAYPMVKPNRANAHFATTCTLPARTGRHVIYAEWGREPPTLERFHGCIDVQIGGGGASSVAPSSAAVSSVRSSTPASVAASSKPASIAASSRASTPSSTASGQQCNWYGQLYPVCTTQSAEWGYENNQSCIGSVKCNSQTGGGGVVGGSSTATTPSSTPRSSVAPSSTSRSSVTPSSVAASVRSSLAPSSVPASSVASGATCNWYGWMVAICKNTSSGWGNENNQTCISQSACNAR